MRKPVWATMRWSGRTDWPSTCQVRCSTSMRLGHAEPRCRRAPARSWRDLDDARACRRRGCPPGCRAFAAWGTTCHGSGRSSTTRSRSRLVDALVAVAHLDPVALERLVAEEGRDVAPGPGRRSPRAARSRRRRRRPAAASSTARPSRPRLEHPGAREDVGQQQDRAEVLGIDDLRAAGHLEHEVRQRRPERRCTRAPRVDRTTDALVLRR